MAKRKIFIFFVFVVIFGLFFYLSKTILDPDFGWHSKEGENILTIGIPRTDPFSYTMPSYPYVDHEWLTNVAMAIGYTTIGWTGLALVSSAIGTLTILFLYYWLQLTWIPILLLVASVFAGAMGIRPQVLSWLFFSVVLFLLEKRKNHNTLFILPPLFLLWANTHGSFAFGLGILTIIFILDALVQRRISLSFFLSVLISYAVTLVNPYGIGIWREVVNTIQDGLLHSRIQEWTPFVLHPEIAVGILMIFAGLLLYRYRTARSLEWTAVWVVTVAFALSAIRHTPYVAITSGIIIGRLWQEVEKEIRHIPFGRKRLSTFTAIVGFACFLFVLSTIIPLLIFAKKQSETESYPMQAIHYLASHSVTGNVFAPYGWGGYLSWKYPQKKVFIDGRMPSFRFNAPNGEAKSAFDEYIEILVGENTQEQLSAYDIQYVLWQRPKTYSFLERFVNAFTLDIDRGEFIEKLKSQGWCVLYTDAVSVVLTHKGQNSFCEIGDKALY
jgi:hypothetical protein